MFWLMWRSYRENSSFMTERVLREMLSWSRDLLEILLCMLIRLWWRCVPVCVCVRAWVYEWMNYVHICVLCMFMCTLTYVCNACICPVLLLFLCMCVHVYPHNRTLVYMLPNTWRGSRLLKTFIPPKWRCFYSILPTTAARLTLVCTHNTWNSNIHTY